MPMLQAALRRRVSSSAYLCKNVFIHIGQKSLHSFNHSFSFMPINHWLNCAVLKRRTTVCIYLSIFHRESLPAGATYSSPVTVEWQSSLQEEAPVSNLARPSPPESLQNNNGRGRFGRLAPPGIEARVSHAARKIHSRPVRPIGGEKSDGVSYG